jgi:hypothetical protein
MADSLRPTVRDLLPDRFKSLDEVARQRIEEDPQLKRMRYGRTLVSGVVGEKVGDGLRAALDCDALDLVAKAWAKAREIQACAAELDEGELGSVALGEHELSYTAQPVAKVTLTGLGAFELTFDLTVKAEFQWVELTLLNSHIIEIGKSECGLSAQLSWGGLPMHPRLAARPVELTSPVALTAPGWPIPRGRVH